MNDVKTAVLLAAISGLLVAIGWGIGGPVGAGIFLVIAAAMNFGSYWFSADIVLRTAHAHEIERDQDRALFDMIARIARDAELPMPRVYIMDSPQPNAFATGRSPKHAAVAVTTGIRSILTERELRGVLGHELAHVKNRDILTSSVVATIAGAISMIGFIGLWFGGRRDGPGGLLMLLVAPIAATLIQLAISRAREYEADRDGARLVHDPEGLASALAKLHVAAERRVMPVPESTAHLFIVNPLRAGAVGGLFATHPPMEERVARLRRMQ